MQAIVVGRRGASAEEISWMVDMFVFGDAGDVLFGSQRSALRLHDLILSAREIRSQVRPNARLCHDIAGTKEHPSAYCEAWCWRCVCRAVILCIYTCTNRRILSDTPKVCLCVPFTYYRFSSKQTRPRKMYF